ncbi:AsnC family transcriptional regulator [Actinomadura namibiensis]|uniref:AsnC family transcriptional regulator n=1 Tax=Actinomadura kijaniata TaxID=46161 RepID=UPI001C725BC5
MDELDLALVNALQLDPRAPWSRLSGPLGVDAATLSRRWSRLTESGAAWVTCVAGPPSSTTGRSRWSRWAARPAPTNASPPRWRATPRRSASSAPPAAGTCC